MGNLDIYLSTVTFAAKQLTATISSFGLVNVVKSYTRDTLGSLSFIDHVVVSKPDVKCF